MVWFATTLGINLSHIHTDETKHIVKPRQQSVSKQCKHGPRNSIYWVLILYIQIYKSEDTDALRKHFQILPGLCKSRIYCKMTTSEVDIHQKPDNTHIKEAALQAALGDSKHHLRSQLWESCMWSDCARSSYLGTSVSSPSFLLAEVSMVNKDPKLKGMEHYGPVQ